MVKISPLIYHSISAIRHYSHHYSYPPMPCNTLFYRTARKKKCNKSLYFKELCLRPLRFRPLRRALYNLLPQIGQRCTCKSNPHFHCSFLILNCFIPFRLLLRPSPYHIFITEPVSQIHHLATRAAKRIILPLLYPCPAPDLLTTNWTSLFFQNLA